MKKKRILLLIASVCVATLLIALLCANYLLTHRVEGKYFDSDGARIHYTDEGSGVPVVLIHGFAVNADLNWRTPGITERLARHYRVIMLDLRGHGLSDKPHDDTQYGAKMVEDIPRLLDHLGIDRAHVAGYSLGGFVTLRLAATHPDRLYSAMVLGAGWESPENKPFLDALVKLADTLASGGSIGPLSSYLGEERAKPGLVHKLWLNLMTGYFNDKQALIGVLRGLPELSLTEEQVRGISLPVCTIVGDRDSLQVGAKAMEGRVKNLTATIIKDADHMQAPMRPAFVADMEAFLKRHAPPLPIE